LQTILVTGGVGFIGGNFDRYLFDNYPDYRIVVLDLLTYAGRIENSPTDGMDSGRYDFWYGDVRNGELVDTLVSQADIVVHMAAESHVTRSIYDNRLFFETDVIGTQSIASAVVKYRDRVERFIHVSTSEVYGTALADQMDEDHPLNPMSPYAAAKCGADRLVYSYWQTYRIPAIIVRPFNNYGPRQHLEKLVPRFITSCILGEPLRVHGDGSAARDWMFVRDHCEALDRLLHIDRDRIVGQIINLGSGTSRSVLEIAEIVRDAMKPTCSPIEFIGDRPGQVFRHTCDASRARHLLEWEPRTTFEDGLEQTIAWYRKHQEFWRPQVWMRHIPIIAASGKREMH
jgi:dTDP-glucose 4,6-dehydratase